MRFCSYRNQVEMLLQRAGRDARYVGADNHAICGFLHRLVEGKMRSGSDRRNLCFQGADAFNPFGNGRKQ